MRHLLTSFLAILIFAAPAFSDHIVQQYTWTGTDSATREAVPSRGTENASPSSNDRVVEGTPGLPTTRQILVIDSPPITTDRYAIQGEVSYENVAAGPAGEKAYLEMWSHFPDGSAYFSRTLGDSGRMQALVGSADRREFMLPFNSASNPHPTRLVVNVVLPGAGRVRIGPLALVDSVSASVLAVWWTERQAGLIGGVSGSLLGILGATIGLCSGFARTRRCVIPLLWFMAGCGTLCLIGGVIAVICRQPYHVYYGFFLCGAISTPLSLGLMPVQCKMVRQAELRKMAALDAT